MVLQSQLLRLDQSVFTVVVLLLLLDVSLHQSEKKEENVVHSISVSLEEDIKGKKSPQQFRKCLRNLQKVEEKKSKPNGCNLSIIFRRVVIMIMTFSKVEWTLMIAQLWLKVSEKRSVVRSPLSDDLTVRHVMCSVFVFFIYSRY